MSLLPPVARPALAQTHDPAAADVLFQQGRAAMDVKDYATACPKFRESQALHPAPGTLFNLAYCEESRGHLAEAWEQYRATLASLPAADPRLPSARQRLAALDPRVPRLTLRLSPGAPAATRVRRDQVEFHAASLGTPLPVNPGLHTVEVDAPGHAPRTETVTLAEGELRELVLGPGPALPAPPPSPPPPAARPPSRPARSPVGLALTAAGGSFLLVSLGTALWSLERRSVQRDHCEGNTCDDTGLKAAGEMRMSGLVSLTTLALGAASAGAGAYLLLSSPARPSRVGLGLHPSGGTLSWRHAF